MVAVVGVVVTIFVLDARHDRKLVFDAFMEERLAATKELAAQLEARFSSIRQDVLLFRSFLENSRLAGETPAQIHGEAQGRFETVMRTLLQRVPHYKEMRLVAHDGVAALKVAEPGWSAGPDVGALTRALTMLSREATKQPPGIVRIHRVPRENAPPDAPAYRVFSTSVQLGEGSGALLLLVAPDYLFLPVTAFRAQDAPRFVLLSQAGDHVSINHVGFATLLDRELGTQASRSPLGRALFEDDAGRQELSESAAKRLGLGSFAVLTHAKLPAMEEWRWTLVALSSAHHFLKREQAVALRAVVAMAAVLVGLIALGGLLLRQVRREVELRENLRTAGEIQQLHELSQKILANVPAGILAIDAELEVRQINRMMTGFVPELAVGAPLAAAFPAASARDRDRVVALARRALSSGEEETALFERTKLFGGEPGAFNVRAIPLGIPLQGVAALVSIEDLSELKRLEHELVRAEKLSTMGILAAGIAHEIGTPLGVVRARAEMLQGKLSADVSAQRSITAIIEQSDAISRIISRVLELARARQVDARPLSAAPAIHEAVELLRERFEQRAVGLTVAVDDALPAIHADPDGFRQVLLNLLRNACDACKDGGHVTIRARAVDDEHGPAALFAVEDTGCGIAPENVHSIFDPFFTTKKGGEGTGLGLAISQDIVKNHAASLSVESTVGVGSTFTLRWPLASAAAADANRRMREETHSRRGP